MKFIYHSITIFALIYTCFSIQQLQFVQDDEALCLDGTRGSYFFEQGSDDGANKYLVFFEGGGWIQGDTYDLMLQYAYDRLSTSLGSSKFTPQTTQMTGIFSRNKAFNPTFYNWNTIHINYCDGTGHQGYAKNPLIYKDTKIYIRGEKIFKSIFNQFYDRLSKTELLLVSGCSAGGLATFSWIQYIRDNLPQQVKVIAAPDSGVFLDLKPVDSSVPASDRRQKQYHKVANVEVDPPNSQCVLYNQDEKWRCHFAQYLVRYINVPLFFVQSLYDAASIPNILKIYSAGDLTLTKCNSNERKLIEQQRDLVLLTVDGKVDYDRNSGAFTPACLEHCFLNKDLFNSPSWQIPYGSGMTIERALSLWVQGQNIDHNHADRIQWPNNSGKFKIVKKNNQQYNYNFYKIIFQMKFINRSITIFALYYTCFSIQQLQFVQDEEALCLDGTLGSYYFEQGTDDGTNKYLIFFEGGGWIQGDTYDLMIQFAYDRLSSTLGSSKFNNQTIQMTGIFSRNKAFNPTFYNWNTIHINYCDGTGHQGYIQKFTQEEKIFKSIFNQFYDRLQKAELLLVSGCSAGGLAAFSWIQYIRDNLPQQIKIIAAPDSGIFLDLKPIDSSVRASERRQKQYFKVANVEVDPPNSQCVLYNQDEKWRCHFAQYLVRYINVPIFFVQSLYDSMAIVKILKIYSTDDLTLNNCNSNERKFIEQQRDLLLLTVDGKVDYDKNSGAFTSIPFGSGMTLERALSLWIQGENIDHNHADRIQWPNNQGCSNIK
ncbi:hypothetical protein pb186bvf_004146 [Paramecium bursaria]